MERQGILTQADKSMDIARAMGYMWVQCDTDCANPSQPHVHQCLWPPALINNEHRTFHVRPIPGVEKDTCILPQYFDSYIMRDVLIRWVCKLKPVLQNRFIGHVNDVIKMRELMDSARTNPIAIAAKIKWMLATPEQVAEALWRTLRDMPREGRDGQANQNRGSEVSELRDLHASEGTEGPAPAQATQPSVD